MISKGKCTVLIGGDVCPVGRNLPLFLKGQTNEIFGDLLPEFKKVDLSIINLECPFIVETSAISKVGPVLGVPSGCVKGLESARINVVNLANNHIMDHGESGLFNTIDICKKSGIAVVGAGKNLSEARKILIRNVNGMRVGILGVAEHEFSCASNERCGAYPLDYMDFVRNIKENEGKFDYLIVLLHGGIQGYPYPSPRLRDTCRFMVEMGANLVVVQHSHCPGCFEVFEKSFIVYGQGNLIFDSHRGNQSFHEGFLVKFFINHGTDPSFEMIPFQQSNINSGASRLKDAEECEFLDRVNKRSKEILDVTFVHRQWLEFCKSNRLGYVARVYGLNWVLKKVIYREFFTKLLFSNESNHKLLLNTVACESHREVLETLLENRFI